MQGCPLWLAQAFVQRLEELCEANGTFLLPSLEAFATLCLTADLQALFIPVRMGCMLTSAWPDQPSLGSNNMLLSGLQIVTLFVLSQPPVILPSLMLTGEGCGSDPWAPGVCPCDRSAGYAAASPSERQPGKCQTGNTRDVANLLELLVVFEFLLMRLCLRKPDRNVSCIHAGEAA